MGSEMCIRDRSPFAKRVAAGFVALVVFIFAAVVMTYGGWNLFVDRYESGQLLSSINLKRAWFYLSIPISGTLISLFALDNIRAAFVSSEENREEAA